MALGASPHGMTRMVVREGAILATLQYHNWNRHGIAALAISRLISVFLFGVALRDPTTFCIVSVFLLVVAVVACYIPARRASRVDPMVALR